MRTALTIPLIALSLGACSLAPVYERPQAPVAAAWKVDGAGAPRAAGDAAPGAAADIGWRDFYAEPALRRLIDRALEHNRDLRIAILNIEAARAQYGIRRADELPTVGAGASASRQRVPADLSPTGRSAISDRYQVDVGVTGFELDFFGRVRSLSEAALAEYLATEEAARAARIGLVAQVAGGWLAERAAAEQIALLERTIEARRRSYELIRLRHGAGVASELELRQAEGLLEGARAELAEARRARLQARNGLELLVGAPLADEDLADSVSLAEARVQAAPPAGLPSALLERRPDVLAAEQRLRGANASIGAARAAFFPRIALTGALGTASRELSGLFGGGSGIWSFVPQISLPLFDAGRNQANLDLAEARRNIAVADYERTIQRAFREVADALAARSTIGERLRALQAQVDAAARTLELSELRYRTGVDSQLQWLEAQRSLLGAEQGLLAARAAELANRVELYKALGGGWNERSASGAAS
ncbi:efflux transporter outer membrane subunit [Zeimonas arvi]|uniref:Efflux transporter outer membrane subunit n=1 Tax=Zeimonas arvi TaxID=2498847 RepID=A0A5C8P4Q5_9BURK|nr:efflux transporter outer membrane subunit [Zeimonas arvi]TXL68651.1 efflux transporter outer membrane subunit [Zeimonas arvi]